MSNLQSKNPFALSALYRGPTILNMADSEEDAPIVEPPEGGEGEGKDPESRQGEDGDASGIDESTPAGQAFAKQRARIKAAEKAAADERELRIRAEAKAEAQKEILEQLGKPKPEKTEDKIDDLEIDPNDEKVMDAYMRKHGITDLPKAVQAANEATQRMQMQSAIDACLNTLEAKFKDSVPFDRDAVLQYAKENGYASDMPNATLERVLERAHRDMNEDAFLDWRGKMREKGKDAPTPNSKGTGPKVIKEDAPKSVRDFKGRARQRMNLSDDE